jgi:hypothetical protein
VADAVIEAVINAHVPPEFRALLEALLEKADASAVLTPQFGRRQRSEQNSR